jgi:hypothetical protein
LTNVSDPFGYERGPEDLGTLEADLEIVRQEAEPLIERLAQQLRLSDKDVMALAVLLFGHYLDLTTADDTITLVVKGTVTPYDSALQAMLTGAPRGTQLEALLAHIEASKDS